MKNNLTLEQIETEKNKLQASVLNAVGDFVRATGLGFHSLRADLSEWRTLGGAAHSLNLCLNVTSSGGVVVQFENSHLPF